MAEFMMKRYDYGKNEDVEIGMVSTSTLAQSMTPEDLANLLDDYLNRNGSWRVEAGRKVGEELRFTHRTLQRLAVGFALELLAGISEQERTDPRNEVAIETAKKVKKMMDAGELPIGAYI